MKHLLNAKMKRRLKEILADDIAKADVTSALLPAKACKAKIIAKEPCVIAGLEEACFLFKSKGAKARPLFKDGTKVERGSAVLEIRGQNKAMLSVERTALNVLGRMSGVATACSKAKKVAGKRVTVALTRKTMPGFNLFDKKAAKIAGIWPHRLNLNEFVLLKDNHLPFFASAFEAVAAARKKSGKKVEVEVYALEQAFDAARAKPDMIMLDNLSPKKARAAIKRLRPVFKGEIELSGGINMQNLRAYAAAKPDLVSMGCLTQDAKSCNFSLELVE